MNEIDKKLDLLVMSDIINKEDRLVIEKWIDVLAFCKNSNNEKIDVFVTHCAMILAREKRNQPIEELNDYIFNEIESRVLDNAKMKLKEMNKIHIVKKYEEGYILVHLCNVLNIKN